MKIKFFVLGVIIGLILGTSICLFFPNRYYVISQSIGGDVPIFVKVDKLTGKTYVSKIYIGGKLLNLFDIKIKWQPTEDSSNISKEDEKQLEKILLGEK